MLTTMAGHDPSDATSASLAAPDFAAELAAFPAGDLRGVRIGLPTEYFAEGLDPAVGVVVEQCVEGLRASGADVRDVSLPHTAYGIATYYIVATAEASSNLGRYDGVRFGHRASPDEVRRSLAEERAALDAALAAAEANSDVPRLAAVKKLIDSQDAPLARMYALSRTEGFGPEVRRRILLGTYVLSSGYYDAYYGRAQRVRTLIRRDFERAFESVDLLLTPAAPAPAFRLGEKTDDPLQMYLSDVYTVTANLAGVPALVVPAPRRHPSGLPVGLQVLGRPFGESNILRVGRELMRA
jgi:aspartyl-tRNA(Asn)/glutamyl-tRNA(Gln) amidotransferase subunit A